jgi:predicted transcriptional regulator
MIDIGRVITAKLPTELACRIDEVADRIDRSRSWIVRQALRDWLTEEQRRCELSDHFSESSLKGGNPSG